MFPALGDQSVERLARALLGLGIAKQATEMVIDQHDAVHLVGELVGVDVFAEVALADGDANTLRQRVEPIALQLDAAIAHRSRLVVELRSDSHEKTAPREPALLRPSEPVLEERAHPRFAASRAERRFYGGVDEPLRRELHGRELEELLRLKMREEAALGEPEIVGEPPDGETIEPHLGGEVGGVLQNRLTGELPFAHASIIVRTFGLARLCVAKLRDMIEGSAAMEEKQLVILAGGLATRMRPRTLTTPKLLLPVAGRPFAAWLLERLAHAGYRQAVLCIAYLGEQIRDVVGDGRDFGIDVVYADEGPDLLGTAGAIRRAASVLAPRFLVTYGDSYLPFDYAAPLELLASSPDADGVMAVYKNEGRWDKSNTIVRTDDQGGLWVERYEKNSNDARFDHIDYGATALRRETILALPEGAAWGLDRIQADLSARKRLRAYPAHARFFEIGSETGLDELDQELRANPPRVLSSPKAKP